VATISLSGLATGIDTSTIISQLVAVARQPMQNLQARQAVIQTQNTDLKTLGTRIDAVKTALQDIRYAADLRAFTVTSSDDGAVTALASSGATEGTHEVLVDRLATAERMVHTAGLPNATDSVGRGTFVYTYGGQTRTIQTTDTTTLEGLRDLINNDGANPGVDASILECDVNGSPACHLVLGGASTGTAYAITIDDQATTLEAFRSGGFTVTQQAQNSRIRVDGYPTDTWMERSSNTLTDVIPGVTLQLHSKTAADSPVSVSVSRDTASLKRKLDDFVAAYNSAVTYAHSKTSYDQATKTAGSLLGEYAVTNVLYQLRAPLVQRAVGFQDQGDAYSLAGQIGLSLDKTGQLSVDDATFDKAVADNYQAVLSLLGASATGASNSDNLRFYGAREATDPGVYDVKATFTDGALTSALIKKSTENQSAWRSADIDGNLIIGAAGNPEQNLQVTGSYAGTGTLQAQVRVRQGICGTLYDTIDQTLGKTLETTGKRQTSEIDLLQRSIDNEQDRVNRTEQDLISQYARLEAILAQIKGQQDAVTAILYGNTQ